MTIEELSAEVASLKRQLKWTWWGAYGASFLFAFMTLSGVHIPFGTLSAKTVKAERIEVVNSAGEQRAFLQVGEAEPQFHILGKEGGSLSLQSSANCMRLSVWAGSSTMSMVVGQTNSATDTTAELRLSDSRTRTDTAIGVQANTPPIVSLWKDGKETVLFPVPR